MADELIEHLLDAGLIQFGAFYTDRLVKPVALHLEMLSSYPDALSEAADRVSALLSHEAQVDRLLCSVDAMGLATATALKMNKPLVYVWEQRGETTLIGAYDIGHPTALILNHNADLSAAQRLIHSAKRVGLDVVIIATLVGVRTLEKLDAANCRAVFPLVDAVSRAESERRIPPGQGEAARRWLTSVNS